MIIGCSLEEAWGTDFLKSKSKKKKKSLEPQPKETIDPNILIPSNTELNKYKIQDNSNILPFDISFDSQTSTYNEYSDNVIKDGNQKILNYNNSFIRNNKPMGPNNKTIELSMGEYQNLLQNHTNVVEGFGNSVDSQLNQLILYIFTGIFFILMMDTMYQLGKKSY